MSWDAEDVRNRRKVMASFWLVVALTASGCGAALGPIGVLVLEDDEPYTYGDDAGLDDLWDACAEGDPLACDDLYRQAPVDSEYEEFGGTCAFTADGVGSCEDAWMGGGALTYGDDPDLDLLWDACEAGGFDACDELYGRAPVGSEYERFASTCGGLTDGDQLCTEAFPAG